MVSAFPQQLKVGHLFFTELENSSKVGVVNQ